MLDFKRLVTFVFLWFERLKGVRKVSQSVVIQTQRGNSLRVIHQSGYDITIYCQRREYMREYSSWYAPLTTYVVYHVFSTTTNDAPDLIKQACKLDVTLPRLLPSYIVDEIQKRFAIDAYVDLLVADLIALKRSF